jgi:hypothetical protein
MRPILRVVLLHNEVLQSPIRIKVISAQLTLLLSPLAALPHH